MQVGRGRACTLVTRLGAEVSITTSCASAGCGAAGAGAGPPVCGVAQPAIATANRAISVANHDARFMKNCPFFLCFLIIGSLIFARLILAQL